MRWSLVVAGEAALVLFLLSWGNSFGTSYPFHLIQIGILGILGLIGWIAILLRPGRLPRLLIVAPLPLLAVLAITSIVSGYPGLSWFATWQCAAYVGIIWLLSLQARHPDGRRNLIAAMGLVAAVVIGDYLIQVGAAWVQWLALGFPISSLPLRPLGSGGLIQLPTWVGDVIALTAPITVVALWLRGHRAPAVVLAVASAAAMVVSGTRSVLLFAVIAAILGAGLLARERASRRVALLTSATMVVVIVIGLGAVFLAGRSFDEGRSSAYGSAIDRFVSAPIAGTGPGTYAVGRMSDTVDILWILALPDAHNFVLTQAAESGLIGVLGLALALGGYVVAVRRTWQVSGAERPIVVAAVLGIGVVAGHALGEVVFALIGVILLLLAAISIASTDTTTAITTAGPRSRRLDFALAAGLLVIVVSSVGLVRSESTLRDLTAANQALPTTPDAALSAARRATDTSPENVPAWWARMLAADATGNAAEAIDSARQTVALEGFGQEWLSLAILLDREGDATGARAAIERATAHPPLDPVVELNAAILHAAAGRRGEAIASLVRLLSVQPDIEPVLARGPANVAALAPEARQQAAMADATGGDIGTALLVALSGEDHALANQIVASSGTGSNASDAAYWAAVVNAWFGDAAARSLVDRTAAEHPSDAHLMWSWRLAARACDRVGADRWAQAARISIPQDPALPLTMGQAPALEVRLLPRRYPGVVWRMDLAASPYVGGLWTYVLDQPACLG